MIDVQKKKSSFTVLFLLILLVFFSVVFSGCTLIRTLFSDTSELDWGSLELTDTKYDMNFANSNISPVTYKFQDDIYIVYATGAEMDFNVYIDKTSDFQSYTHVYTLQSAQAEMSYGELSTRSVFFEFRGELYCAVPAYDLYQSEGDSGFHYRLLKYNESEFVKIEENFLGVDTTYEQFYSIVEYDGSVYVAHRNAGSYELSIDKYSNGDFSKTNATRVFSKTLLLEGMTSLVVFDGKVFLTFSDEESGFNYIEVYSSEDGVSWTTGSPDFHIQPSSTNDTMKNPRFHLVYNELYLTYYLVEGSTQEICLKYANGEWSEDPLFALDLDFLTEAESIFYFYLSGFSVTPLDDLSTFPIMCSFAYRGVNSYQLEVVAYNQQTGVFSDPVIKKVETNKYYYCISPVFFSVDRMSFVLYYDINSGDNISGLFYTVIKE